MAAPSIHHHMEMSHGIVLPYSRGVDVSIGGTDKYIVYFLRILKPVECPVE